MASLVFWAMNCEWLSRLSLQEAGTLCLLAETLAFTHPHSGARVQVRASLPAWAVTVSIRLPS